MVNYACAKKVPDSTKLRLHPDSLLKGQKTKLPRPRTPLVCLMFCTRIHTCPPNNPYNLILPPPPPCLGKKLKETLFCRTEAKS